LGGEVLGRDEVDELLLPYFLLPASSAVSMHSKYQLQKRETNLLDNVEHRRVGLLQVSRQQLCETSQRPFCPPDDSWVCNWQYHTFCWPSVSDEAVLRRLAFSGARSTRAVLRNNGTDMMAGVVGDLGGRFAGNRGIRDAGCSQLCAVPQCLNIPSSVSPQEPAVCERQGKGLARVASVESRRVEDQ
jgi:hypothetical protein